MNKIINKLKGINKLALAAGLLLFVALGVVFSYSPLRNTVANILPFSTDPAVTITPTSGPLTGGTEVEIIGEDFNATTKVYFDLNGNGQQDEGEECLFLKHMSATRMTCITPASETVGWKDLRITARTIPGSMQATDQEFCQELAVFNGASENPGATVQITDTRNDVQYEVARLADGNCWMLQNLRIDDHFATALDTDLNEGTVMTDGFTIPAAVEGNSTTHVVPYVQVRVDGMGEGETNYGLFYNAFAILAGTHYSELATSALAPNSICPANWRLPTGYASANTPSANEFGFLNARMVDRHATTGSLELGIEYRNNWNYEGPFKGVIGNASSNNSLSLWSSRSSSSTANTQMYIFRIHSEGSNTSADRLSPGSASLAGSNRFSARCILR